MESCEVMTGKGRRPREHDPREVPGGAKGGEEEDGHVGWGCGVGGLHE
jgi:hypothetical protein